MTIPFERIGDVVEESNTLDVREFLNETQRRILDEIAADPDITYEKLAEIIGKSQTIIENGVRSLRSAGLIERVGSKKTGSWRVL